MAEVIVMGNVNNSPSASNYFNHWLWNSRLFFIEVIRSPISTITPNFSSQPCSNSVLGAKLSVVESDDNRWFSFALILIWF